MTRFVSTDPGPTSTKVRAPAAYMPRIWSTNRTGFATAAATASRTSAPCGAAVGLCHTGMLLASNETSARNARNGSTLPATRGEWNAVATCRRLASMPAFSRRCSSVATASVGPDTTTCSGALWFAITQPGTASTWGWTISRVRGTAVMAPGTGDADAMSSPRRRAMRKVSAADNTPAACSAVISP